MKIAQCMHYVVVLHNEAPRDLVKRVSAIHAQAIAHSQVHLGDDGPRESELRVPIVRAASTAWKARPTRIPVEDGGGQEL